MQFVNSRDEHVAPDRAPFPEEPTSCLMVGELHWITSVWSSMKGRTFVLTEWTLTLDMNLPSLFIILMPKPTHGPRGCCITTRVLCTVFLFIRELVLQQKVDRGLMLMKFTGLTLVLILLKQVA